MFEFMLLLYRCLFRHLYIDVSHTGITTSLPPSLPDSQTPSGVVQIECSSYLHSTAHQTASMWTAFTSYPARVRGNFQLCLFYLDSSIMF